MKRIIKKGFEVYEKLIPDVLLLLVALMSLIFLYTSKKHELWDFFDLLSNWLSSLAWYWFLIVMILALIKPAYTIYTWVKKSKKK